MENRELKQEIRRAAKGDEDAATFLFDAYHPRVYRYALAKLGTRSDAEDVAAETFAVLLREVRRFRRKGAGFEAWLFRTAGQLVIDRARRGGKEWTTPDGYLAADRPYESAPEGRAGEREVSPDMVELLDRLSSEQREILLLRFAAGLETDEAAAVIGRKPNVVRQLQLRALTALREKVERNVRRT